MRRFQCVLLATVAAIGFVSVASAADMPVKAPVYKAAPAATAPNWTGWYIGANAGWVGSADNTITNTGTDTGTGGLGTALLAGVIPGSIDLGYSGFIGGGQLGYNWQAGNWVYGLEADFDGASAKSSVDVPDAIFQPSFGIHTPLTTSAARELDWLGTFRGRVGFTPAAPLLLFATGGLAVGQHKLGIGITDPTAVPAANLFNQTSSVSVGWTIGAGAEWMFAPQWSLKAEYLYVDLGNISSTINYAYATGNTSTLTATVRDTMNIVRGGINYHF
jgi:outer membrane immunogenic protein